MERLTNSNRGWVRVGIPAAPVDTVHRPRLHTQLDEALDSRVGLIVAPAGSGKTALAAAWAGEAQPRTAVAWVSLHEHDDRATFWLLVASALDRALGSTHLQPLVSDLGDDVHRILAGIAEAVQGRDVVLVLDDLHEVTDPEIFDDLRLAIRGAGGSLPRFLLLSRTRPPLRLERLRLAGGIGELSRQDLAFRADEAAELLRVTGVQLDAATTQLLLDRTLGWAAALRLAGLALRGHADPERFAAEFTGDEKTIAAYLVEEVVAACPPDVREFLTVTAIPDVVSGEMANALMEGPDSGAAALLVRLYDEGMPMIALDERRVWFRYHPLLRSYLVRELTMRDPERLRTTHLRALAWFDEHDDWLQAARHAVRAGDGAALRGLVERNAVQMIAAGHAPSLRRVVAGFPEDELGRSPALAHALSIAALDAGDLRAAERWTAWAECAPEQDDPDTALMGAVAAVYRGRITGDVEAAIDAARLLISDDPIDRLSTEERLLRALAHTHLGAAELWTGRIEAAQEHLEDTRRLTADTSVRADHLRLIATELLATLHTIAGDLSIATRLADEACTIADRHGWGGTTRTAAAETVRFATALLRGDVERARALADGACALARQSPDRPIRANAAATRARLALVDREWTHALAALDEAREAVGGTPFDVLVGGVSVVLRARALHGAGDRETALATLLAARDRGVIEADLGLAEIALAAGDTDAVLQLIGEPDSPALTSSYPTFRTQAHLVLAIALDQAGDVAGADADLLAAIGSVAPDERLLAFLDAPIDRAHLGRLLDRAIDRTSPHRALGLRLRTALEGLEHAPDDEPGELVAAELSERERALLRMLTTALTNAQIGEELFISQNTVKTHLRSIYRKLDVRTREEAVRRARKLGLLSAITDV